jgi:hypothetical protein
MAVTLSTTIPVDHSAQQTPETVANGALRTIIELGAELRQYQSYLGNMQQIHNAAGTQEFAFTSDGTVMLREEIEKHLADHERRLAGAALALADAVARSDEA